MSITACQSKEVIKQCKIPQSLLVIPSVEKREVNNQDDVAELLIDLYEGYKKSVNLLEAIRNFNDKC